MEKPRIVLCADDDPDDRELLCETAYKIEPGIQVVHGVNGKELLEKLQQLTVADHLPCLIILDVNMPILNGIETLVEIKKNPAWDDIPIALFTTSHKDLYVDLERRYGISVVTKPANYATIVKEVTQLLSYCKAA